MGLTFQNKSTGPPPHTSVLGRSAAVLRDQLAAAALGCLFNDATLRLPVQDSSFLPFPLFRSV